MKHERINPKDFSELMGSYSHGVKVDVGDSEMIFVTGQLAMGNDGIPLAPKNIKKQTEIVFEHIKKILQEANATIDDIVKVVIYVKDINNFSKVSAIRNKYLKNCKPASTFIEVSRFAKEGCDIEIEAIAIKKKGGKKKKKGE